MKTKHIIIGIIIPVFLIAGNLQLWAQEGPNMSPVKQQLYDLGFGVFSDVVDAPDFTVPVLHGSEISLSDLRGKVVLLNLWATWCPPCRAEMPSMQELYTKLNSRGFEILAVAAPTPPRETIDKITDYVAENGFSFPILIDDQFEVNNIYGTGSIPTSYVINTRGELIARLTGSIDWTDEKIIEVFTELLSE